MLDGFLLTAQQVGVLFALMTVGYVCRKTNFLSDTAPCFFECFPIGAAKVTFEN